MEKLSWMKEMFGDYVSHLASVFKSLHAYAELKLTLGLGLAIYGFFFAPEMWQMMVGLLALVTFDLITGLWVAKVNGIPILSRKICKTPVKFAVYSLLVSAAHITESALGIASSWAPLEQAMIGFLAATELVSIIENAGRMGFAVPQKILNQLEDFRGTKKV